MANAVYPLYKKAILDGAANSALTGTGATGLWVALIDTGTYVYSAAHQFYSDLSGIVGTDVEITGVTTTAGVVDGADVVFTSVVGASVEALVLYRKNAGANTTWRLVAYIGSSVVGLPALPNGGDVTVTWNASGIFAFQA